MSKDITEADWAMADRIIKMQQISPPLSERHKLAYTSMLVRNGIMNSIPVDVDPDIAEAEYLALKAEELEVFRSQLALGAIKRGRELERAKTKPWLVWVKHDASGKCPVDPNQRVCVLLLSGDVMAGKAAWAVWQNVSHYIVLKRPLEMMA